MYGINKKIFVCNTKIIRDSHLKFMTFELLKHLVKLLFNCFGLLELV